MDKIKKIDVTDQTPVVIRRRGGQIGYNLRIRFDDERNGFVVEREAPALAKVKGDIHTIVERWTEVIFVKAGVEFSDEDFANAVTDFRTARKTPRLD